ncbi:MAG: hypothetical protein U0787_11345 [Polyangia bacterium]
MHTLVAERFATYVRKQWAPAGFLVSEVSEAPYKELVAVKDGWSFGLSVARESNPDCKARIGIFFRPAPRGGIGDLAALRTHYQTKLAQQRRGSRIKNCGLPIGQVFLFFETTGQLGESAVAEWVSMVDELSDRAFDPDGLDELLGVAQE